jgi:hypothetical protein
MNWQQHPQAPWVEYAFEPAWDGNIWIHLKCTRCGGNLDWHCKGGPEMAGKRVAYFATEHSQCGRIPQ